MAIGVCAKMYITYILMRMRGGEGCVCVFVCVCKYMFVSVYVGVCVYCGCVVWSICVHVFV